MKLDDRQQNTKATRTIIFTNAPFTVNQICAVADWLHVGESGVVKGTFNFEGGLLRHLPYSGSFRCLYLTSLGAFIKRLFKLSQNNFKLGCVFGALYPHICGRQKYSRFFNHIADIMASFSRKYLKMQRNFQDLVKYRGRARAERRLENKNFANLLKSLAYRVCVL